MGDDHELPDDLASFIGSLARFTGDLGDAAEVDWMEQTVTVIGQMGQSPDQYDAGDVELVLQTVEGNLDGLLDDHYDGELIKRDTTDGGFRYVFDVSMYDLPREPKKTRIPFNEDVNVE